MPFRRGQYNIFFFPILKLCTVLTKSEKKHIFIFFLMDLAGSELGPVIND